MRGFESKIILIAVLTGITSHTFCQNQKNLKYYYKGKQDAAQEIESQQPVDDISKPEEDLDHYVKKSTERVNSVKEDLNKKDAKINTQQQTISDLKNKNTALQEENALLRAIIPDTAVLSELIDRNKSLANENEVLNISSDSLKTRCEIQDTVIDFKNREISHLKDDINFLQAAKGNRDKLMQETLEGLTFHNVVYIYQKFTNGSTFWGFETEQISKDTVIFKGKRGVYVKARLIDTRTGEYIQFKSEKYTTEDIEAGPYVESLINFQRNLRVVIGNNPDADYLIAIEGSADEQDKNFNGRIVKDYKFDTIQVLHRNKGYYNLDDVKPYNVPASFKNEHLPNMRAEFIRVRVSDLLKQIDINRVYITDGSVKSGKGIKKYRTVTLLIYLGEYKKY
ncbi:hypothetical protein COB64_03985 [Candidatus Wolfebacteria bacterium]|nr:MAG: hypothetical protein COB64_03985 [Candidatus Wolfebacteria bacterium]